MKRSEINALVVAAQSCFGHHGWTLPPNPRWDVTDFGLSDWRRYGLVLVNLAEEPEYCEKLMFALEGMRTPAHHHRVKKEDIICRTGRLAIQVWSQSEDGPVTLKRNGIACTVPSGETLVMDSGERVTLFPGTIHEFWPLDAEAIIGEVSTANDDLHDNLFVHPDVGRYPQIEEDEPPLVRLVSDR